MSEPLGQEPDPAGASSAAGGGDATSADWLDTFLRQVSQSQSKPVSSEPSTQDAAPDGRGKNNGNGGNGADGGSSKVEGGQANMSDASKTPNRAPSSPLVIPSKFKTILDKLGITAVLNYVNDRRHILAPYEMRQAINPEMTSAMAEKYWTRGVPGLEGWRNVLVVLPLTVTWLSLGLAALAYEESQPALAKLYKTGSQPDFFQLWQQGFPQAPVVHLWGRVIPLVWNGTRILTFTDVALVDVGILLLMLALTALSQMIIGAAVARARKLEVWLNQTLHKMSIDSVVWSLAPNDQQPRWAAEVQTAINALNGALADVSHSVTAFKQEIVDQGRVVREAVAQTGAVPVAVNDLIKIYTQAIEAQELLKSALPTIDRSLTKVASSQEVTATNWMRMSDDLGQAIESVRRLVEMLGGTTDLEEQAEEFRRRYSDALGDEYPSRRRVNTLKDAFGRIKRAVRQSIPFRSR